jgi:predicted ATPase
VTSRTVLLPGARSELVGRRRELSQLDRLLESGVGLMTLWGPGGAGKSHLGRHFIRSQGQSPAFKGGVLSCDLTTARNEADLFRRVATAIQIERADHISLEDGEALSTVLASRPRTLLLMDNAERAAHAVRDTLEIWMDRAPHHCFLITSREPLGLRGEALLEIGPLPEAEATQLFLEAARAARGIGTESAAELELVRKIVDRLDRLPLAIELAAGHLVVLELTELRERLGQQLRLLRPRRGPTGPRHRALEESVRWSWDSLSPTEQASLARCAVFRGGFCTEAAEALLPVDTGGPAALEVLESLRLRSLLEPATAPAGTTRLRLYEAVREFAEARSQELGLKEESELRHARVTLALTEGRAVRSQGLITTSALEHLASESENLLAVHERFAKRDPVIAARALLALHPLLLLRGPYAAHSALLDEILSRGRRPLPKEIEARLRLARGEVLRVRGRIAEARADLERARRLTLRARDKRTPILILRLLGSVARMQGRLPEALRVHRAALARARAIPDSAATALCVGELGTTLLSLGRLREACRKHRAALDLHRALGDRWLEGIQLSHLGVATHRLGHVEEAQRLHEAALAIHRELGNRRFEAAETSHLAFVHHQLGHTEQARACYRESLELCRAVSDRRLMAIVQCYLGDLESEAGEAAQARLPLHEALGFHERAGDHPQQAVTWLHLGYVYERSGQLEESLLALENAAAHAAPTQSWVRAGSHAHRASLLRRLDDGPGAARARRLADRHVRGVENPYQALAVRLLTGRGPTPCRRPALEEALRCSSDVRRAMRWSQRGTSRELWVGPGSSWFSLGEQRADLSRRGPMRRILEALVTARLRGSGAGIPWHGLWEAGWPDERVAPDAGLQRVYTAIWALRKLGLESALICRENLYSIDPALPVRRWET